jgi:hypothetical protein
MTTINSYGLGQQRPLLMFELIPILEHLCNPDTLISVTEPITALRNQMITDGNSSSE